jgi:ribonucleoside-diphosphate reductase alpha chain
MNKTQEILSDITVFNKYAKYIPEISRRETFDEICDRNMTMHIRKFPQLKDEIRQVYKDFVRTKKVLPSMRSLQFGGMPIELSNTRIFNCSYLPIEDIDSFSEVMFLLLSGTGVGFSVQRHHIERLPVVVGPTQKTRRFLVGDSIEGWADAIKVLIKAYFKGKSDPIFDYRDIRAKGARLVTSGGKAPGPDPLRICIDKIRAVLNGSLGKKLTTLEAHDILCHIADAVLSGGIRRAAMISLFSHDDLDMLSCKSGPWWELNPQRGRANNSVLLHREFTTKEQFDSIWQKVIESGAGEPGVYWSNDFDWGTNPCVEIGLRPYQFCNLTEINVSDVDTQEELEGRTKAATFIGTLQAAYTDFHYLRPIWEETTKADALIGVSMTGIGSGAVLKLDLVKSANVVKEENERIANIIGINVAARTTAVKPAGCVTLDTRIKVPTGNSISMEELFALHGYDKEFLSTIGSNTWLEVSPDKTGIPLVLDENNDPQEVTKLYVNGVKEVFEIEFEDGNLYKLTGNHKLKTKDGTWKRVDELTINDEILSF